MRVTGISGRCRELAVIWLRLETSSTVTPYSVRGSARGAFGGCDGNACDGNACDGNACEGNACDGNACDGNACDGNACHGNACHGNAVDDPGRVVACVPPAVSGAHPPA